MKLTKEQVQQRVLKDGKPLDLKLFDWDIKTRTFKSEVYGLVIDFTGIDNVNFVTKNNCTFKTGHACVFNTRSKCNFNTGNNCMFKTNYKCIFTTGVGCIFDTCDRCTFDTGSYCTFTTTDNCVFNTGSNCSFKTLNSCTFDTSAQCSFITRNNCTFVTGSDCVFDTCNECRFITNHSCNFNVGHKCVIINKINNEVIKPEAGIKLTIGPIFTPGYLVGSDYYVNDVKQDGVYMTEDGILSKIISKKGNIYKVNNYIIKNSSFDNKATYIVQDGDVFSHGETIEEARESLIYKINDRDTSVYDNLTIDSILTKEEAIKMYRVITGACAFGVRNYVESLPEVNDTYSVQEIVDLTTGQYGNDMLRKYFKV